MTKLAPVKEFTVTRAAWMRGKPKGVLYDKATDTRCCVGFFAHACGLDDELDLERTGKLSDATAGRRDWNEVPEAGLELLHDLANKPEFDALYTTNDNAEIDDTEREKKLTELFSTFGIAVRFED